MRAKRLATGCRNIAALGWRSSATIRTSVHSAIQHAAHGAGATAWTAASSHFCCSPRRTRAPFATATISSDAPSRQLARTCGRHDRRASARTRIVPSFSRWFSRAPPVTRYDLSENDVCGLNLRSLPHFVTVVFGLHIAHTWSWGVVLSYSIILELGLYL